MMKDTSFWVIRHTYLNGEYLYDIVANLPSTDGQISIWYHSCGLTSLWDDIWYPWEQRLYDLHRGRGKRSKMGISNELQSAWKKSAPSLLSSFMTTILGKDKSETRSSNVRTPWKHRISMSDNSFVHLENRDGDEERSERWSGNECFCVLIRAIKLLWNQPFTHTLTHSFIQA